jgi:hypothetical protein
MDEDDLWCNYSGMPSPISYIRCDECNEILYECKCKEKRMNKEQQDLLNEVYEKYLKYTINGIETGLDKIKGHLDGCLVEYDGYYEHFTNPSFAYGYRTHNQQEFINKCKTDTEFSQRWGLKIEEKELSLGERSELFRNTYSKKSVDDFAPSGMEIQSIKHQLNTRYDNANIPTKLITITYNDKTIESYES